MIADLHHNLYKTLEFNRVLDDLAGRTCSSAAAHRIGNLKPLAGLERVKESLGRISELRALFDSGGSFPLEGFQDISQHLESATMEGSYLEPEGFRAIEQVLGLTATMERFFSKDRHAFPLIGKVALPLTPIPSLAKEIDRCIDLLDLEIRDQASPALAGIRRSIARAGEQLRRRLDTLLDRLWRSGVLQERIITMREGRWVLPVKENHRHRIKGVLHDRSASGATLFIEPLDTLELSNQIRRLKTDEREEMEKILRGLTGLVRESRDILEQDNEVLIDLDLIHAAALASKEMDQHEPAVSTRPLLEIRKGRHPLLALRRKSQAPVVPLDISIGNDFNTLVITGPNAGGKTVALKTMGLLALLVSCGLHIPADPDSHIPLFNRIFAHVGDAQSIDMDLSTFSANLQGIKTIVDQAGPGDLVLIDEIGSGTDPQEGAALAMAALETLTARGSLTVVTTHQGVLKAFAHDTPGIENGSMALDSKTLAPTYRFRPHIPGSSYALEIARRMGLAETVVSRSRELIGLQANRLEDLILRLQDRIEENEELQKDLDARQSHLQGIISRYQEEQDLFAARARELRLKAAEEAMAIIQRANAAAEKAIRTIREKGATAQAIREARTIIQDEKETLRKELEAASADEEGRQAGQIKDEVEAGDRVYWRRGGVSATVLTAEDATGHVLITSGDMKVRVPGEELAPAKTPLSDPAVSYSHVTVPLPGQASTEIDIRGMRVEEALDAVDRFVNDAMLAGLLEVRIIHGMGTGALRNSVTSFLNQHPLVLETCAGGPRQDNPGVTVVKIAGR